MKSVEMGALWKRKDKNGKVFLTGNLNIFPHGQINIVIFENDYKTKDTMPDMKIYYTPVGSDTPKEDDNNIPF